MKSAELNPLTGDYASANAAINDLMNSVYVRVVTPLGGWWADPSLGMRQYVREKDVQRVRSLIVQALRDALKPLLADGRAKSVDVRALETNAPLAETRRMGFAVEVVDVSDRRRVFEHYVQVGA